MKVLILSDIHDNVVNLEKAIQLGNGSDCEMCLFAGDLNFPPAVEFLAKFNGQVHMIWGNNEGEKVGVMNKINSFKNITHHGNQMDSEFGGLKVFMTHYPEIADLAYHSSKFDVVIYGHTHEYEERTYDSCLVLNPGALLGYPDIATCIVFDTITRKVDKIVV